MYHFRSFLFSVFLFSSVFSFSQSTLIFKVQSKSSVEPLEYAVAQLYSQKDSVVAQGVSNRKGKVELANIPGGAYKLKVSYLGYESQTRPVEISRVGKQSIEDIVLNPGKYSLDEVNVTGEASPMELKLDKQVINVSKQINAQGGTAADALQYSPSIQVDAEGNVSLRGSTEFMLLIDGRPSVMDASSVLTTMQSETIDKIEIITNPSAKYTAEGNTGIINIITKSKSFDSTSGLASAMVANGDKYSASAQVESGFGKINWFGGVSYSSKLKINEDYINRTYDQDNTFLEHYTSEREVLKETMNVNTGIDAKISEKNLLRIDAQAGKWKYGRVIHSVFSSSQLQDDVSSTEDFSNNNLFFKPGIDYQYTIGKDHKLSLNGQVSFIKNDIPNMYIEEQPLFKRENSNEVDKRLADVRLDYSVPLNDNFNLEAGAQYTGAFAANHIVYRTETDGNTGWIVNDDLSNDYNYGTSNLAGYAMLNTNIIGVDLQAGLRAEYNQRAFENLQDDYACEKVDLFPSVHLSKKMGQSHQFGLSYGRRVNRPTEWQLYPLAWSGDRFNLIQGNPGLKDEYNHSFELNYGYFTKKIRVNTQAYYQLITNKTSSYVLYDSLNFVDTYESLGNGVNSGLDIMLNYRPLTWFNVSLSASGYYEDWNGESRDGVKLEGSTFSALSNLRTTFIYKKNTICQFMAIYYAPRKTPQGSIEEFYYFDFILKQYLFERKLSLTLRTHNTFDTGIMKYEVNSRGYRTNGEYVYEGPTIIFSASYRFNNFKAKRKTDDFQSGFDTGLDH